MIYLKRDNKRRKKKTAIVVGIVAFAFFASVALNFFKPNILSPVTHTVFSPILEARGGFFGGVLKFWNFLRLKATLAEENQMLKNKLVLFEAAEKERDYYKNANEELLRLAEKTNSLPHAVFVPVLSKPGFSIYDTIIIGAGTDQNIKKGDKVLADQDTVIGIVAESYAKTSVVNLYSSPGRETPVLIGKNSIQAVALGKGGGNFEIKLPRDIGIVVGDSIALASSSPAFLGAVEFINISPTDSFERAIFRGAVDINRLSFVAVLRL